MVFHSTKKFISCSTNKRPLLCLQQEIFIFEEQPRGKRQLKQSNIGIDKEKENVNHEDDENKVNKYSKKEFACECEHFS